MSFDNTEDVTLPSPQEVEAVVPNTVTLKTTKPLAQMAAELFKVTVPKFSNALH